MVRVMRRLVHRGMMVLRRLVRGTDVMLGGLVVDRAGRGSESRRGGDGWQNHAQEGEQVSAGWYHGGWLQRY